MFHHELGIKSGQHTKGKRNWTHNRDLPIQYYQLSLHMTHHSRHIRTILRCKEASIQANYFRNYCFYLSILRVRHALLHTLYAERAWSISCFFVSSEHVLATYDISLPLSTYFLMSSLNSWLSNEDMEISFALDASFTSFLSQIAKVMR